MGSLGVPVWLGINIAKPEGPKNVQLSLCGKFPTSNIACKLYAKMFNISFDVWALETVALVKSSIRPPKISCPPRLLGLFSISLPLVTDDTAQHG